MSDGVNNSRLVTDGKDRNYLVIGKTKGVNFYLL